MFGDVFMNQLLTTALLTLSALHGGTSPVICQPISNYDSIYQFSDESNLFFDDNLFIQNDVYDLSGSCKYSLFSFQNKNYLVDRMDYRVIDYYENFVFNHQRENVLLFYEEELFQYDPSNSEVRFLEDGETFELNLSNRERPVFRDYFVENDLPIGNIDEVLIPDAFYFEKLKRYYGLNYETECGIVASQMLLGYYDIFQNDLLIDEIYETGEAHYIDNSTDITDWVVSPGTDDRLNEINTFKNKLIEYFPGNIENGATVSEVSSTIHNYLETKNVTYSITSHQTFFVPDNAMTIIDSGRPVILGGVKHFCVAFGYNSDSFFVCDGNGRVGSIPKAAYTGSEAIIWSTGCIGLTISQHVHSDNYYSSYNNEYYCPCGERIHKTQISPSSWGFESQYYFYDKYKQHTIGNLSFETNRLRTGFIENEVVNLSPRRQNAGNSYLRIVFQNIITKVDINMGWWSNNEHQNDGTAMLYYKDTVGVNAWYTLNNILNNTNMSQSHSNLSYYSFVMPEEAEGIMFNVTNQAVGDTNKGRLSIGTMTISYIYNV